MAAPFTCDVQTHTMHEYMIINKSYRLTLYKALESVMYDVIKINLKRRIATRSGKVNMPLSTKTAVERPILKLGLPNFKWSLYSTSRCIPPF